MATSAILSQHASPLDIVWARQFSFICSPSHPALRSVQVAVEEAANAFASAEAALKRSVTSRGLTMFKMSAGVVLQDTRRQLADFTLLCGSLCVRLAFDSSPRPLVALRLASCTLPRAPRCLLRSLRSIVLPYALKPAGRLTRVRAASKCPSS